MPKYNVRRKAQLGLDIREGGIAIPIANNMFYIDGRKHAAGGVAIGPNNKNGVEVEGGEVVEMIDSNHPSVGRQFKAGGQKQTMRVFSSVPLLRGASPAELVLGGANPDAVFKAQEEFKNRNRINDDGTTYEVGGEKRIYTPSKSIQRQIQETGRITIGGAPTIGGLRTAKYVRGLANAKSYAKQANKIFTKVDNLVNNGLQGLINKHKITPNQADAYKKFYNEIVGVNGVNIPKTVSLFVNNENKEMRYGGRIKAPWGLEAPIEGGYYPESSEPQTIKWLSDWLNGRRVQLYENAASSPSHNFYYSKPFDEIRGLSKGISANRLQTNRVFYSLINNAASATHKIGDTVSTIASGQYDKKANEITYPNSNIDMNSSIHERTHAMKSKPQTVKIKTILGDRYKQPWGEPDPNSMTAPLVQYMNQYLSDPEEIYSRMMEYRYNSKLKPSDKVDINQLNNNRELLKTLNLHYISDEDLMNLFNNVAANKDNKVKAKYGGSMIYEINGNVRNGLMSARPKAEFGKDVKYPYVDGNRRYYINNGIRIYSDGQIMDKKGYGKYYILKDKNHNFLGYSIDENENRELAPTFNENIAKKAYEYSKNKRPQYYAKKQLPIAGSQSIAEKAGLARSGWSYTDSPTFDYVPNINISVPINYAKAVGDNSKKSTSSTARGEGNKSSKSTTKSIEYPSIIRRDEYYSSNEPKGNSTPIDESYIARQSRGIQAVNEQSPSSTGGGTQSKDGRWIGQYKTTNAGDWIGLGSNLAGSVASYFMTKNTINKMPEPIKPVMAQAAKLKTRYNIEPQLTNVSEAEQMNRASVRRNTQSSNTSLAREQRLMNEARSARNSLYGQKENIETQLINQDKLNRQSVMRDNVRTYNEYLNRVTATKMAQNEMRASNINNLISGLTGSVNNILGTIESRRTTNNTLRAIAAANPNVDARLIGGFDYYIDPITKKKYNKNQQYIETING